MAFRYSWLAGAAALLFVLYQLNDLLKPTVDGPPWQLVVVAALVLGVALTWTALAYRLPTWVAVVINAVAAAIAIARVTAPETTWFLLPTGETLSVLRVELEQALDVVRNGIEPVIPYAGLVVMLLVLFWTLGFLFAWGLSRGLPYVALIPPLVVSLQFATMDRQRTTPIKVAIFVTIVAAALLAITLDRRQQGTGRMVAVGEFAPTQSQLSRSSSGLLAAIIIAAVGAVTMFNGLVPADGVISWRSPTGLTGGFTGSSVSYSPFIQINQRLVKNSNIPLFTAQIEGTVPADQVYFSLLTMESYSGGRFSTVNPEVTQVDDDEWVEEGHAFAGPVDTIISSVEIEGLAMDWLPGAPTPVEFAAARNIASQIKVRTDDGALHLEGGRTFDGMTYQVRSEISRPDPAALAAGPDGTLSAAFQEAANADETVPQPVVVPVREGPPDAERFLDLPDDLDPEIGVLARAQTRNLTTPFEKAIALESWFRSPDFQYSTDIAPGQGADDLAAWLTDKDSPNHRIGYCENFATAMAVMARTLEIPSRVVLGFTPGTSIGDGRVVVLDRNAHAWVELWMPAQGWVRFDPTPRRDEINPTTYEAIEETLGFALTEYLDVPSPEGPGVIPLPPGGFNPPNEEAFPPIGGGETSTSGGFEIPGWVLRTLTWLGGGLLILGGIPIVKWWRRRRRLRRLRTGDISAAWEEIVARLDDLGTPPLPADTPSEVAGKVDPALVPLAAAYSRSIYGGAAILPAEYVAAATKSFEQTEQQLVSRHSRVQRLKASYRIRSLVPKWLRGRADS